jgi:two-component system, response regulator YesN
MVKTPKVLVVDDDEGIISLLGKLLRREFQERIAVTTMTNSVAASHWIERVQPDVIVTDLDMPDADGFALSRDAKRWNSQVEIIVFSGGLDECIERFASRFGASECVAKNGDFTELLSAVERALERLPIDR